MIQEFAQVGLEVDVPEYGLIAGDVGTVVDMTNNGEGVTLEFFNFAVETVAIVPLYKKNVRTLNANEVIHARVMDSEL